MAVLLMGLLLLLTMAGHSGAATYCLCNTGLSDPVMQKNIDYACGSGADCSGILQNGPCFNPNTVKDHCNYAVNSYFQNKGQVPGSCDFSGTASPSSNAPAPSAGCVYPSSASRGGTPGTGTGGNPGTGNPGGGGGLGTGTTFPGSSPFPLAPTGGINNPDNSGCESLNQSTNLLYPLIILFSGLMWLRA